MNSQYGLLASGGRARDKLDCGEKPSDGWPAGPAHEIIMWFARSPEEAEVSIPGKSASLAGVWKARIVVQDMGP